MDMVHIVDIANSNSPEASQQCSEVAGISICSISLETSSQVSGHIPSAAFFISTCLLAWTFHTAVRWEASWKNFIMLKYPSSLDLSYNEFEGRLSGSFIYITSLKYLILSFNHLKAQFLMWVSSSSSMACYFFVILNWFIFFRVRLHLSGDDEG